MITWKAHSSICRCCTNTLVFLTVDRFWDPQDWTFSISQIQILECHWAVWAFCIVAMWYLGLSNKTSKTFEKVILPGLIGTRYSKSNLEITEIFLYVKSAVNQMVRPRLPSYKPLVPFREKGKQNDVLVIVHVCKFPFPKKCNVFKHLCVIWHFLPCPCRGAVFFAFSFFGICRKISKPCEKLFWGTITIGAYALQAIFCTASSRIRFKIPLSVDVRRCIPGVIGEQSFKIGTYDFDAISLFGGVAFRNMNKVL